MSDSLTLCHDLGTVGDVRGANLNTPPTLTVYIPYWQRSRREASFAIRTAMDPAAISAAARAAIQKADPEMPVPEFRTMDQVLAASVAARHFQLTLVLLFGAVALLLACLGPPFRFDFGQATSRSWSPAPRWTSDGSSAVPGSALTQG